MSISPNSASVSFQRICLLLFRVAIVIYAGFITWASLQAAGTGESIAHMDKLFHIVIYGWLAFVSVTAWPRLSKIIIWLGCTTFGGLNEMLQATLTFDRTASILDGIANGLGAGIVLVFLAWLTKKTLVKREFS